MDELEEPQNTEEVVKNGKKNKLYVGCLISLIIIMRKEL